MEQEIVKHSHCEIAFVKKQIVKRKRREGNRQTAFLRYALASRFRIRSQIGDSIEHGINPRNHPYAEWCGAHTLLAIEQLSTHLLLKGAQSL